VNRAGVSFRRSAAIWSVTLVAYVGSCVGELVFVYSVLSQVAIPILVAIRPPSATTEA
jgi:hypothetical protein